MTVSWSSTGAVSHQPTTATPGYPTTLAAGDFIGMVICSGEATETEPGAPTGDGWVRLGSWSGGPGSFGEDDGPRRVTVYWKQSDGTETGTESVTIGGSATGRCISAQMFRLTKTLGTWVVGIAGGSDTTDGTDYSVTGSSDPGGYADGHVVCLSAWHPDTATPTSPTCTWTGTGPAALTGRSAGANGNGNDVRLTIQSRNTTGTSAAAPIYACTLSAAGGGSTAFLSVADVNVVLGAASGSLGFTGAAAGTPRTSGAAAATFNLTAAAAGVPRVLGAAAAAPSFSGAAAGVPRVLGTALAAVGFTGSGSGVPATLGVAVATIGFTGSASGMSTVLGAAVAAVSFTGSASGVVGQVSVTGTATGAFAFAGAAVGQPTALGVAVGLFGGTGAASGRLSVLGAAVAVFGFTGAAAGGLSAADLGPVRVFRGHLIQLAERGELLEPTAGAGHLVLAVAARGRVIDVASGRLVVAL